MRCRLAKELGGPMIRSLYTVVTLASLGLCSAAYAQVLGVEAAGPLKRWTGALKGVSIESIAIQKSRVEVSLKGDCVLSLDHPESPGCAKPQSLGDAVACWSGDGCPSAAVRASAVQSAGELKLPWRTPGDGKKVDADASRETALVDARKEARFSFWRNDLARARSLMEPVIARDDLRPEEWMSLLPLASHAGLGAEAFRVTQRAAASTLGTQELAALRVTLLMGPQMGAAVARSLLTADNGCAMEKLASAFVDVRAYGSTILLAEGVRGVAPDCFEAYSDETEAATMLQDLERQRLVVEQALERFRGDPRLEPMEAVYLLDQGKGQVVQERLEKRLAAGDRSPGLLKELLTFYIQVEGRPARMKGFISRADSNPQDTVAAFFAGVLLHYERQFERSQAYLNRLKDVFPKEARLHIYLAMNAFNLGQRKVAEDHINRAALLDTRDPDVPYCIAEIYRDTNRKRAIEALRSYWSQTTYTSNPTSEKQRRVWAMKTAIERCQDKNTPPPCPGPWEHYFDQVSLDAQARVHADMVAELKEKGLIGGGTEGAPEDLMVPPGFTQPPEGWEPGMPLPMEGELPEGLPPDWRPGMPLPKDFKLPPGFKMPKGMPEEGWPAGWKPGPGWKPGAQPPPGFKMPAGFQLPPGVELPEGYELPKDGRRPDGFVAPADAPRAPAGMPRGVPFEDAHVPGSMPPGYEPPKNWKAGDPMVPGLTPPDVQKRRIQEGSRTPDGKTEAADKQGEGEIPAER